MNQDPRRRGGADFDQALRLLDHELERLDLGEPVRIRAIGGYALIAHGVRTGEQARTIDIDTVTRTYSAAVREAIAVVATRTGLDQHWLNNESVGEDPELVESMYEARWQRTTLSNELRNIDIAVADVPTLTRAKIMAVEDAGISGRDQDVIDLKALLDFQKIDSFAQARREYPILEDHPDASDLLAAQLSGANAARIAAMREQINARVADLDWGEESYEDTYSY